jgi:hypothetical protein
MNNVVVKVNASGYLTIENDACLWTLGEMPRLATEAERSVVGGRPEWVALAQAQLKGRNAHIPAKAVLFPVTSDMRLAIEVAVAGRA